jgi:hypothetical protein
MCYINLRKYHCVFRLTQPVFITFFQTLRVSIKPIIVRCLYKNLKFKVKMQKFATSHK